MVLDIPWGTEHHCLFTTPLAAKRYTLSIRTHIDAMLCLHDQHEGLIRIANPAHPIDIQSFIEAHKKRGSNIRDPF